MFILSTLCHLLFTGVLVHRRPQSWPRGVHFQYLVPYLLMISGFILLDRHSFENGAYRIVIDDSLMGSVSGRYPIELILHWYSQSLFLVAATSWAFESFRLGEGDFYESPALRLKMFLSTACPAVVFLVAAFAGEPGAAGAARAALIMLGSVCAVFSVLFVAMGDLLYSWRRPIGRCFATLMLLLMPFEIFVNAKYLVWNHTESFLTFGSGPAIPLVELFVLFSGVILITVVSGFMAFKSEKDGRIQLRSTKYLRETFGLPSR